jgi:hypothetical protein
LRLEALDERVNPSTPSAATHLLVLTPPAVYAGAPSPVEVVALDASNHRAAGYTGTVHFTSSDAGATLPADYTFTAADRGVHVFTETPAAVGTETLTATDTTTASVTGSVAVNVAAAPVATHFAVVAEPQAYVGAPVRFAVVALDVSNHIVPTYTGTVHFTSSNASDTLPADYTFTASDRGVHVFTDTPAATGSDTLTATDTATASVTGSVTLNVTPAPVATHFAIVSWPSAVAGTATSFAVVALDASNHIVPTYTGTVHFTSSDAGATLPTDYTFTAADRGVHVFSATFTATGSQTITATDTATASLTGSVTVRVRTTATPLGWWWL